MEDARNLLSCYIGNVCMYGEAGYLELATKILNEGQSVMDRTGVGTKSLFGEQLKFDLRGGFPLLTTKRVHRKSIIYELLWFLRGDTNVKWLNDHGVTIWDEWADENGDLGPVYSKQWRSWPGKILIADDYGDHDKTWSAVEDGDGADHPVQFKIETIDQISNVIASLKASPHGRRHIVSAWNPAEVDDMALPPCHCLFQFYMRRMTYAERVAHYILVEGAAANNIGEQWLSDANAPLYYLDCQLYQRSADLFLGVPFNIASYALLTHMIAQQVGAIAGTFTHTFGDVHIYNNHVDQMRLQLSRNPKPLPQLELNNKASIFDYEFEDVKIKDYKPWEAISAPVAK